jgi:hypothetical protein
MLAKQTSQSTFKQPISWMGLLTTTAVFSVVTGAVVVGFDSKHPTSAAASTTVETASATSQSPLGLRVTSRKQQVEIRWDHNSRPVTNASKAVMKITEGETTELIRLDHRDLQDGFVSYTPMTKEVQVRFDVIAPDGTSVSESARVVAIP